MNLYSMWLAFLPENGFRLKVLTLDHSLTTSKSLFKIKVGGEEGMCPPVSSLITGEDRVFEVLLKETGPPDKDLIALACCSPEPNQSQPNTLKEGQCGKKWTN